MMSVRFAAAFLAIFCFVALPAAAPARPAMVSAANPHAAEAAARILRRGGSAVDAAIAAQLVLGLVEPQSSGIGGGAFLVHWDAKRREVETYDGRETAPAAATPDLFLDGEGKAMRFMQAVVGGRAVGVPGLVAMMALAHKAHGRLAWAELFEPAIALAREGFAVSPRLNALIARSPRLAEDPSTRAYFFLPAAGADEKPVPLPVGYIRKNPAYADTLRKIARQGPDAFYRGAIAMSIVETVATHANAGKLALSDLANYRAKRRPPVCGPYRGYRICSMAPPTSGGVTLLQILGILENFDLKASGAGSAQSVHLISEASKLAYADRAVYLADPDFVDVPTASLLAPDYLRRRAKLIDPQRAMGRALPGRPALRDGRLWRSGVDISLPSTSQLSIVDARGNAVSMTTSVEGPFGANIMASGFILNNQLTDFSFVPTSAGRPVANAVAANKRPRSSMTPTLVFDKQGRLFAVIGSPGGSRIIAYVAQSVIALIDWGLDMQSAISLARHVNRNGVSELEAGTSLVELENALEELGQSVKISPLTSGLQGIRIVGGKMDGGADPRREGVVLTVDP